MPGPTGSVSGIPSPSRRHAIDTACRRCHSRKVKCSRGQPCDACKRSGKPSECTYPRRSRLVKVNEDYLDRLVEDSRRLRSTTGSDSGLAPDGNITPHQYKTAVTPALTPDSEAPLIGPSTEQPPWFQKFNVPHAPILISEACDTAVATRFRQCISSTQYNHPPRLNYPPDDRVVELAESEVVWPSLSKAKMLVNVAIKHVGVEYHIVLRSQVLRGLEQTYQDPESTSSLFKSKLLGLFAIGELYSVRMVNKGEDYPGLSYFAKATRGISIVCERPRLDAIELRLLLAFYSLSINRRHSAFAYAGSSVRHAVLIGLHLNVPESQLSDIAIREHRNRLWWTAYIFDRMCVLNLGNPVAAVDDVIDVSLPMDRDLPEENTGDFTDTEYYIARSRLAQLSGKIVQSIYVRRSHSARHETPLAPRVQASLKDLHEWSESLPSHLSLKEMEGTKPRPEILSLHLEFNQCVIVATRMILLHITRARVSSWRENVPEPQFPESARTLAEACSKCARRSIRLLFDSWLDGSFPTLDCFYAQYLFSATTALTLSNLRRPGDAPASNEDLEKIDTAKDILGQLRSSGHLAAKAFCQQLDAIQEAMDELPAFVGQMAQETRPSLSTSLATTPCMTSEGTTEVRTEGASLQDLLMQPSLDLQFIDDTLYQEVFQGLYWQNVTPGTGIETSWVSP